MGRKRTDNEFKTLVFKQTGNEYTFLDKYVTADVKLHVRHNKCGTVYLVTPHSFLRGNRCLKCSYRKRGMSDSEFKSKVYDRVGNKYTFLDEYNGYRTKLRVKHNDCGNVYKVRPDSFLRGNRCPKCSAKHGGKLQKLTNDQFKERANKLVGNEYTFLDNYVDYQVKLRVKHNKCNNVYKVSPSNFLKGGRCPYCAKTSSADKHTISDSKFRRRVEELVGNDYTFLEKYKGANTDITVKHNKCGNIYKVRPSNFLSGSRCPICSRKHTIRKSRLTNKQFKQNVYDLVGNEYTFLNDYVNNRTKLLVIHNKCGNKYYVTPYAFLRGHRCPKCSSKNAGKKRRLTNDQFQQRIYNFVGNEYTFLDRYINSRTKLRVRHNKCGNIYKVVPNRFLYSYRYRCPFCSKSKTQKHTTQQFKDKMYSLVGNEYTLLDDYKSNNKKVKMKHNKCNCVYYVTPNNFQRGKRCPQCNLNDRKNSNEEFLNNVKNEVGGSYTFLDRYIDSGTKLRVKHNKCGLIYKVTPNSFFSGNRCPQCSAKRGIRKRILTNDEFNSKIYGIVGNEYSFLDKYVRSYIKLRVRHNVCGHVYYVTPSGFLDGNRCPRCALIKKSSQGENSIRKWLDKNNYDYQYGYFMKHLKDRSNLHLDFYMEDIATAIEYDGEQHFKSVKMWQGQKGLKKRQKHDRMKDRYCKDHNIKLIRIKYDENVNDVLDKQLGKISG